MTLDAVQLSMAMRLCAENPELGRKVGYQWTGHLTPDQFIKLNGIELIDGEPEMTQVVDYDALAGHA